MKIYLAGPLFTEAEQLWLGKLKKEIEELARRLERHVAVVWPYELIDQAEIDRLGDKAKFEIFSRCKSHLDDAEVLVALLDGAQVDDGTAWEIGYFYARKSPSQKIIGVRTDFRRAGESEGALMNAMIECSCEKVVSSREALLDIISRLFLLNQP